MVFLAAGEPPVDRLAIPALRVPRHNHRSHPDHG
jgi:hypothetical protein